jgi:hypothetical protein
VEEAHLHLKGDLPQQLLVAEVVVLAVEQMRLRLKAKI